MAEEKKLTKDENIKEKSNYLRGTIKEELAKGTVKFAEEDSKLLKFHGIYQQDNRDSRQERIAKKLEKEYIFMIRTKLPGGKLTPEQYLGLNEIADNYTNKTLRITARQTIQFHGVVKGNLRKTMNEINKKLIVTYGGCGDVVRNVMAPPIADIDPDYPPQLLKIATDTSNHFLPASEAYFEIWVEDENGKKIKASEPRNLETTEPIYGKTYLPRKFKIGIGMPFDNSVDIYTQDVGVMAITENSGQSSLIGFNIIVGGGLGFTHNKSETYPRLGSLLCFVTPDKLIDVLEKTVTIQRDYGGRENRKHARMKYLIDDKGLDWFKKELEKRVGFKLEPPKDIEKIEMRDYLGWHKQSDGNWYLGVFVENGRIQDKDGINTKTAFKEIVEKYNAEVRLTPQQNIIFTNIQEKDKQNIERDLEKHSVYIINKNLSTLRRNSIACVALPTCGLAMAESERVLPGIIDELEKEGFGDEEISIRMSGCPNSCSRPPVAEIGIIGISANMYNMYIGGDFYGKRLNKLYKEKVSGKNISKEIIDLLTKYRKEKKNNEKFGDFCNRVSI